jgi:FkbM family methyltransferase
MDLKSLLKIENPVIFEAGCSLGQDTEKFCAMFENPDIYCFEPGQEALKEFEKKNLPIRSLFKGALSDIKSFAFYHSSNNQELSGSIMNPLLHLSIYPQVEFVTRYMVQTITLDEFMKWYDVDIIDFFHLDCQGAEEKVFSGGENTFRDKVKYLYTEFSNVELYEGAPTKERILELLPNFELVEIVWEWMADGNMLLRNKNLT